ncbi:hypothetical protein HDV00_008879 [Rhizophlyctis rosea]|nr:hypothetical protein HDV00_008879 [Rhizophlyctis rosea]
MANKTEYKYIGPSFAGQTQRLTSIRTWETGLDADNDIALISTHNYIGGARSPGITLRGTLMNHTRTVLSISTKVAEKNQLAQLNHTQPYILGETNSLYNQGAPRLSDSFGAALWNFDYSLWCASVGIGRVHFHQGTNYRYQSWQPVNTSRDNVGTKPPFYGNLAVAAALKQARGGLIRVQNLPIGTSETDVAYAIYRNDLLKRVVIINLNEHNTTTTAPPLTSTPRANTTYSLTVPSTCTSESAILHRLIAPGANSITNVTYNGMSYDYDKDLGRPVKVPDVEGNEQVPIGADGVVYVTVPWSSAVVVQLRCPPLPQSD